MSDMGWKCTKKVKTKVLCEQSQVLYLVSKIYHIWWSQIFTFFDFFKFPQDFGFFFSKNAAMSRVSKILYLVWFD